MAMASTSSTRRSLPTRPISTPPHASSASSCAPPCLIADSVAAVMLASLLHDSGMTIGRKGHELYSGIISYPIIEKILSQLLPEDGDILRRTIIRSIAIEGIIGHMATHPIHSIEAGIILIADGCDMTKGRARIPLEIPSKPAEGDIHKYSANAIEKVKIGRGNERPLKIEIPNNF